MHFTMFIIGLWFVWRMIIVIGLLQAAMFQERMKDQALWRLLLIAFLGAVFKKWIENRPPPPRDDFDGNVWGPNPYPPKPSPEGADDLDKILQKVIEHVKERSRERVG